MNKKALITGVTGQDGSYLTELLLEKNYKVFGLCRRTSRGYPEWLETLTHSGKVCVLDGNLRDLTTVRLAMEHAQPDEVYNLAAQSHVGVSFKCPDETWDTNYYGVGRVVNEALKVNTNVRIYQASTSEMFGSSKPPQNEDTLFSPVSPYAEAKLRAHEDFVVGYRERRDVFVCSGILFNHESPRRGKDFVTRKITYGLAHVLEGKQSHIELGNLEARRDWGFAGDYVEAMWLMLQRPVSEDFVIATGVVHTVRDFIEATAKALGVSVIWEGRGLDEVGRLENGEVIVKVNPAFYRPIEVDFLCGDASKAYNKLGWKAKTSFDELVRLMVESDLALVRSPMH